MSTGALMLAVLQCRVDFGCRGVRAAWSPFDLRIYLVWQALMGPVDRRMPTALTMFGGSTRVKNTTRRRPAWGAGALPCVAAAERETFIVSGPSKPAASRTLSLESGTGTTQ